MATRTDDRNLIDEHGCDTGTALHAPMDNDDAIPRASPRHPPCARVQRVDFGYRSVSQYLRERWPVVMVSKRRSLGETTVGHVVEIDP